MIDFTLLGTQVTAITAGYGIALVITMPAFNEVDHPKGVGDWSNLSLVEISSVGPLVPLTALPLGIQDTHIGMEEDTYMDHWSRQKIQYASSHTVVLRM